MAKDNLTLEDWHKYRTAMHQMAAGEAIDGETTYRLIREIWQANQNSIQLVRRFIHLHTAGKCAFRYEANNSQIVVTVLIDVALRNLILDTISTRVYHIPIYLSSAVSQKAFKNKWFIPYGMSLAEMRYQMALGTLSDIILDVNYTIPIKKPQRL